MGTKRLIFLSMLVLLLTGMACGQTLPDANLVNTPTTATPGPLPPPDAAIVQWGYDNSVPRNVWGWTTGGGGTSYNSGYGICNGLTPGYSPLSTAITPGIVNFGSSNYWHTDVTSATIDPNSAAIIAFINATSTNSKTITLAITAVNVSSGVLTIAGTSASPGPTVGRTVLVSGTAESWLNGQTVTVTGVLGTLQLPTGITATIPAGAPSSFTNASDAGTAVTSSLVVYSHPDFGTASGIPFSIVDSSTTGQFPLSYMTNTNGMFDPINTQADFPALPAPSYLPIEGLPPTGELIGDQHAIVLDKNTCWDYEMYQVTRYNDGTYTNGGMAIWDLINYNLRPVDWTSIDAAGFPILPGLIRHDEVAFGNINHAIRVTFRFTHDSFVYPATHWAGNDKVTWNSGTSYSTGYFVIYNNVGYTSLINGNLGNTPSTNPSDWAAQAQPYSPIPMGMRLRLKPTFNMSGYSEQNQVILRAMQQYGVINADNGSNLFLTGTVDGQWNDSDLHDLTYLSINDFDVITMPAAYTVLNPNYSMAISGCTNATFLNGNTYIANMTAGTERGWAQETAAITHSDYATTADTCTATFNFPTGSFYTLPATWTATVATVNVTGDLLTLVWTAGDAGSNIPNGALPIISSFTATPSTIASGQTSTLNWAYTNGTYEYLTQCDIGCPSVGSASPQVGVTRGTTQIVSPTVTTTYTLNVLNNLSQYGITQHSVTVTVH